MPYTPLIKTRRVSLRSFRRQPLRRSTIPSQLTAIGVSGRPDALDCSRPGQVGGWQIIQQKEFPPETSTADVARSRRTPRALWALTREALAGEHRDYTTGSIRDAIVLLAIPMVLELCLESVFAVVDVFFVARLGADAVATVALTESILVLLYAVAMGLSVGAMAVVARRIGEKDADGAARAAVQAILLGLFVAVPVGLFGGLFARSLLEAMGASPNVAAGSSYATIVLGANGVIMMLFLINAVFRGAGDAAIAMRVLWI